MNRRDSGLGPNHRISGGKVLKRGSRKVVNPLSIALRLAARTLRNSRSALGATRQKNGGRSSTAEPRIVVPAVSGSNPVDHLNAV